MTRFERWMVWLTSIATAGTGIAYAWMKYLLSPVDPWAVVNHPLQPIVLKAHILAAPLLVFAIGLIAARHIWSYLRTGIAQGRRTGVVTVLITALMIASGYLVQVVFHEGWLRAIALAHLALGVVYALGLGVHQVVVRRSAAQPLGDRVPEPAAPRATQPSFAASRAGPPASSTPAHTRRHPARP